jgi:hypothetical protein
MLMQVLLVEQVTWNEIHEIYLTKKLWLPMCQLSYTILKNLDFGL